jgi:hypothetical protein
MVASIPSKIYEELRSIDAFIVPNQMLANASLGFGNARIGIEGSVGASQLRARSEPCGGRLTSTND